MCGEFFRIVSIEVIHFNSVLDSSTNTIVPSEIAITDFVKTSYLASFDYLTTFSDKDIQVGIFHVRSFAARWILFLVLKVKSKDGLL